MDDFFDVVVYHNSDCSKSREVLDLIRFTGIEPHIVEYLKTPPSASLLCTLAQRAGVDLRAFLNYASFNEIDLTDETLSQEQLANLMYANPELISRPIVVSSVGVRLCNPPESVLDLLKPIALTWH